MCVFFKRLGSLSPGLSFFFFKFSLYIFIRGYQFDPLSLLSKLLLAIFFFLVSPRRFFFKHLRRVLEISFFQKTVDNKQNKQQFHNNLQTKKEKKNKLVSCWDEDDLVFCVPCRIDRGTVWLGHIIVNVSNRNDLKEIPSKIHRTAPIFPYFRDIFLV